MADPQSDAGPEVVATDNSTKMEVDSEPAPQEASQEVPQDEPKAPESEAGVKAEGSAEKPVDTSEAASEAAPEAAPEGPAQESSSKPTEQHSGSDLGTENPSSEGAEKPASSETAPATEAGTQEETAEKRKAEEEATSANKKPKTEGADEAKTNETPKPKNPEEMSPLERAQEAAEKARINLLPELDPEEAPAPGTGLPRHQHKYSLSAIRAIKRLKDAVPFVAPVDPVAQGVPHYFDYIKNPMDLGTIEKKLVDNKYDTVREIVDDFNLVVSNCIIFNGESALISKMALSIAQSFKKQLSNMPTYDASRKGSQAAAAQAAAQAHAHAAATGQPVPSASDDSAVIDDVPKRASTATTVLGPNGVPTLRRKSTIDGRPKREVRPPRHTQGTYAGSGTGEGRPRNKKFAAELRFSGQVLREMQSRKLESIAWPFLVPVDPIEQGAPTYFDVIKEPMDLSTISKKLSEGIYYNAEEFESDVRLMFRNCYTFNPEGTPVNVLGHKLEEHFDQRWLDKPVPGMHNEDSDYSDVDEEYMESGMDNPAISVLEEQLRLIKKQLKKLKKDALADFYRRGHRKSGGGTAALAKRRRSSNAGSHSPAAQKPLPTEMTYEMKRELRDRIDKLPEKKINTVISIIQESMPDLGNNGQEEIELEVDALDTQTLLRLYYYAVLGRREPVKSAANGANGHGSNAGSPGYSADLDAQTGKRRSKALSEEEHERKIAEIESKLKEFDSAANPNAAAEAAQQAGIASATAPESSESRVGPAAGSAGPDSDSSEDEQPFDSDSSSEEE